MGRKIKNIYDYLCDYTEKEIDYMIYDLSFEDRMLLKERYGYDLHNPVKNDKFTLNQKQQYYNHLVPKMRRLLAKSKINITDPKTIQNIELDLKKNLLELISNRKSNKEICEILNIGTKQLYDLLIDLKNNGLMLDKKYCSDGTIIYKTITNFGELKRASVFGQTKNIMTDYKENRIKLLLISDLHFGNELERKDLIDRAFNYCIKNGIHIILCGGDLIDGTFSKGNQKIYDLYKQIEYFVNNYPHDKSILTFSVAGDHDYSAFSSKGLNLNEICNNFRHDIIIGGYNNSLIHIKNDEILLYHRMEGRTMMETTAPLILHGHLHQYKTSMENNKLNVTLPSLSDINNSLPGALELNIGFKKGYFDNVIIKHIYFENKDIILSESAFNLSENRKIKYVEPYRTQKPLTETPKSDEETPESEKKLQLSLTNKPQ